MITEQIAKAIHLQGLPWQQDGGGGFFFDNTRAGQLDANP
jgi:hypothetical protein